MKKTVVLITGASAGIGKATTFAFAREGANLVISGRKSDLGESLAKELRNLEVEVEFVLGDVRKESDIQALVERTVKRFGHLDVAVNNAGTEGSQGCSLTKQLKPINLLLIQTFLVPFYV